MIFKYSSKIQQHQIRKPKNQRLQKILEKKSLIIKQYQYQKLMKVMILIEVERILIQKMILMNLKLSVKIIFQKYLVKIHHYILQQK